MIFFFTIENVRFMNVAVILTADVTVYLCSTLTRFWNPLLQNTVLFKWVLIVSSNEHCKPTSLYNAFFL